MAVNRYRLRHQARLRKPYAIRILHLLKRPDRVLGVILIGNTTFNMLASSLATLIGYNFWGDKGALLTALVLTFVMLIFGEIAPKTIAALYPEKVARAVVYPIQFVLRLFYPLVWLANTTSNALLWLCRIRVTGQQAEPISREELRSVVYDTTGKMSRQYQNMLLGILDLTHLTVGDVMIPRHEIVGIDISRPWPEIVEKLNELDKDWVPVFRESRNQMIGVLYAKDMIRLLLAEKTLNKDVFQQFLQAPYFVPDGTSLHIQLTHFQQSQDRIAFVVDEYGEILGLLTLNDILEEIVGDLTSNVAIKRLETQKDGSYVVDGAMTVREFNRSTEWELPVKGPRTLNGLITEYLEALPRTHLCVLIAGYPMEIMEVKDNRVKKVKIYPRTDRETVI
jgi:Mg2+/Co2+ transporter CorB